MNIPPTVIPPFEPFEKANAQPAPGPAVGSLENVVGILCVCVCLCLGPNGGKPTESHLTGMLS